MSERLHLIVVPPSYGYHRAPEIDWSRINRLISRGFTRLYPINGCWVICAKRWVTQKRAMQMWRKGEGK